jgi:hypothetical protein
MNSARKALFRAAMYCCKFFRFIGMMMKTTMVVNDHDENKSDIVRN